MEGSAGQKRISADFIRSFRFVCPTNSQEQRDLAELLDEADALVDVCGTLALPATGLFVAMLVTRMGQANPLLLGRVLECVGTPLVIAGRWVWMDVTLPESLAGTAQLRRIFLDPVTVGAWRVMDKAARLPEPDKNLSAGAKQKYFTDLAGKCFDALLIRRCRQR